MIGNIAAVVIGFFVILVSVVLCFCFITICRAGSQLQRSITSTLPRSLNLLGRTWTEFVHFFSIVFQLLILCVQHLAQGCKLSYTSAFTNVNLLCE